jgi:hypothetical protein
MYILPKQGVLYTNILCCTAMVPKLLLLMDWVSKSWFPVHLICYSINISIQTSFLFASLKVLICDTKPLVFDIKINKM